MRLVPTWARLTSFFSIIWLISTLLGVGGCKPSDKASVTATPAPDSASLSTQGSGTAAKPIMRIVALNSDALEALRLLEADDRVVGVFSGITYESDLWPHLAKLPQVGKWSEPNIEAIAKLKPDAVIHYSKTAPFLEEKLKPFGIQVLRLDFFKVHSLEQEINALAHQLGKQAQAQRFNSWNRNILEHVAQKVATLPKKASAYFENYSDYSAAGPGSGLLELCELAGCNNIAAGLSSIYPKVAPEWVVAAQPEMILKIYGKLDGYLLKDASEYNRLRQQLLERPGWKHIAASKNGRVYVVDGSLTSGPRVAIAVAYIAQWLYPQHMQGINADAFHKEYLEKFMKVPFKGKYFSDAANQ